MSCSERDGGCAAHDFENERLCVRQIGEVVERWQTPAPHHVVELGLHLLLDQRLANGKHHGPLQRRLHRFAAGTEHIADDLLHLTVCIQYDH